MLRPALTGLLLCASLPLLADVTINNNESCDISVTPAATLLLPYFEVDTAAPVGVGLTTLFTVVNTSRYPQIAHVTVWTDWGYPVLGFNLFLTGYDVQGINLFDVLVRGVIVPSIGAPGTSISPKPGAPVSYFGGDSTPLSNTSNPNFILAGSPDVRVTCNQLPGVMPTDLAVAVKNALTTGTGYLNCGSAPIGFNHGPHAVGYITVDVVSYCTSQFPTDSGGSYFSGPSAPLLFDNVLSGDYQVIGPTPAGAGTGATFDAEGGPMVHIHAVPEGGLSGAGGGVALGTNLPFTFYDRYTPSGARTADRRQPLPSTWSVRFIQGGVSGFTTDLKIWREGVTAGLPSCQTSASFNSALNLAKVVRFDEHENSYGYGFPFGSSVSGGPAPAEFAPPVYTLPATSRSSSFSYIFPPLGGTDVGGWLYLDLSSGSQRVTSAGLLTECTLSAQHPGFNRSSCVAALGNSGSRSTTQNWVIASMFGAVGANRLSVDFDVVALANGCTPGVAPGTNIAPATQRSGLVCPKNAPASSCAPGTVAPPVNP
jgi:hypothetical protein